MEREDLKDLTLSILVVVVALLLIDCIWLHVKCSRTETALSVLERNVAEIAGRQKTDRSFADQAKETYDKLKSAAGAGYRAARDEFNKE